MLNPRAFLNMISTENGESCCDDSTGRAIFLDCESLHY
jgi:hypothetical protein